MMQYPDIILNLIVVNPLELVQNPYCDLALIISNPIILIV
jgi:hypothetical protein